MHKFPYEWTLAGANFTKDKGTVFSCFSCGGGSTMGYKLAGFDVIGCNEIDPKMMEVYRANHNPKYHYLEGIQTFKDREDLPEELFNLDILDGSPPCSSFSMAGTREKDWGKKKKFREGQAKQVLDTLFFDFLELAGKLQPKVVIAENVKGILQGKARKYLKEIGIAFDRAGYFMDWWLLDASKMGVPQKRERVFFIGIRKDLAGPFCGGLFGNLPKLDLRFNGIDIPFGEIEDIGGDGCCKMYPSTLEYLRLTDPGDSLCSAFERKNGKRSFFGSYKTHPGKILLTIKAHTDSGNYHHNEERSLTKKELCKAGSFPLDYKFLGINPQYLVGMSVPPIMTAQIASRIYDQWLSKI